MLRILLIDDSQVIHSFVTECFQGTDCILEHAMNGREGVEAVVNSKVPFDLIFLDWEMPVMTGPETLKSLNASGSKIPVIMLTTKNSPDDIAAMLGEGVAEYCMKPFTQEILFEKIELVTGKAVNSNASSAA